MAAASVASADTHPIYPLSKVQRGQTGYGMTTFAGSTPERFTFEVVSVVKNFLPKQDIILVKSSDPKVQVSGFWQGMSGSPLYIEDKLVCAFSYGFRFNKMALGGCTPLEYMKKEGDAHRRAAVAGGPNGTKIVQPVAATMSDWKRLTEKVDVADAMAALGPPRKSWLLSAPLPPPLPTPASADGHTLMASVPMTLAGFSTPSFNALSKLFADSAIVPVRAGGTGAPARLEKGPTKFQMGGSIAVELIRGDMAAAATGTVSHIEGNKVLAFGHPMFQSGETYAPVSTVHVHTVVPSAMSAFVMGSPINEIGSLVQDRQATIMADLQLRSPMIPISIEISSKAGNHVEKGTFKVEILDNKFLTPSLAAGAVANAINYYLPDRDAVTARVDSTVRIKGHEPISFTDYMYGNEGALGVFGGVRGLRVLVPLLLNPFAPVKVERVDIKVELAFEHNYGEIEEVRVPTAELIAGERNTIEVRMQTYNGKDILEPVIVDVPASLAGSIVQLEVSAGDSAKLDAAPPVDLPSLLGAFRRLLPGNVWAVTLYKPDDGVALEGKRVGDLPASALDKLHPQTRTQRVQTYKAIARTVSNAKRVIEGSSSMLVRVRAR